MAITAQEVNKLRQQTGAGMMDCKKALEENNGDFEQAIDYLRKKGAKVAANRGDRDSKEGVVLAKTSADNKRGILIWVNCETDFVARTDGFKAFVHNIALQIASMAPMYVSEADIPATEVERVRNEAKERSITEGKPVNMLDKIVDGQVKKHFDEIVLLNQVYVMNDKQTVADYLKENISKTGENLIIRQFKRIELGVSE